MSVELTARTRVIASRVPLLTLDPHAAQPSIDVLQGYLADGSNRPVIERALRIRAVEQALYDLFGKGKLHGTIHTCIGQEFTGALLAKHLQEGDFVTSNHRCHGHFIATTENWRGLIDEIIGNGEGVCAGIGSSQHLWAPNFMSNGQQGGMLPVAAGVALDRKLRDQRSAVVSFIGEGTLGEGIVYETFNLDSLWQLPHVVVCENNFYSQSTPQHNSVAGVITERAEAFGIASFSADTWDLSSLDAVLATCLERARTASSPSFLNVQTYRLNPHSKGDDQRDKSEIEWFRAHDPVNLATREHAAYRTLLDEYDAEIQDYIRISLSKPPLAPAQYFRDQLPRRAAPDVAWHQVQAAVTEAPRVAQQLNDFFHAWLTRDDSACFLGEDIADPYGGAFKVAKGLTTAFPSRARTTPISEAAITGAGIGLALAGRRAFVEIMFADFITYAFDQLINNASKFFHIYDGKVDCPVIVRTPVGGRRGYGPTHSQSLERFLIGIDNVCTISLNSLVTVDVQLAAVKALRCPVLVLENKSDYAARPYVPPPGFILETDGHTLPTLRIHPRQAWAAVTILAYGGMARFVADHLEEILVEGDAIPDLVVLTGLHPLNLAPVVDSLRHSQRLVVVEEGGGFGSVGAEVIAQLQEHKGVPFTNRRVSGKAVPVPSSPSLEAAALPSVAEIAAAILELRDLAL